MKCYMFDRPHIIFLGCHIPNWREAITEDYNRQHDIRQQPQEAYERKTENPQWHVPDLGKECKICREEKCERKWYVLRQRNLFCYNDLMPLQEIAKMLSYGKWGRLGKPKSKVQLMLHISVSELEDSFFLHPTRTRYSIRKYLQCSNVLFWTQQPSSWLCSRKGAYHLVTGISS